MASFIRMPFMFMFHQCKCVSAIKRILSTTATYTSTFSFLQLCVPCHCYVCLSLARCVWEWRRYTIHSSHLDVGKQHLPSMGVERTFSKGALGDFSKIFLGGVKSGEICFFPLETKKTTFSSLSKLCNRIIRSDLITLFKHLIQIWKKISVIIIWWFQDTAAFQYNSSCLYCRINF